MGHGGEFGLGYGGPEEWSDGWVCKERKGGVFEFRKVKKREGQRQKEHGRLKVSGVKGVGRGVAVLVKIKNKKNGDGSEKERKKREGESRW